MSRFPAFAAVLLPRPEPELARRLLAVSPWLERQGALVVLDPRGTERLHGTTTELFAALGAALAPERPLGLGLAHQRLTAEFAARYGHGPIYVPRGDEGLFLARLPLEALPVPPRLGARWKALGLANLGDLASLPAAAVERRYGAEGLALHRLARGEDARGLCPEAFGEALEVEHACPDPVDRLPRLEPALAEALVSLAERLAERGVGARVLVLGLRLECPSDAPRSDAHSEHRVRLPEPEGRAALLLDLLRRRLERDPPPRAVLGFALRVVETGELAVHQNALFGELRRDAARRREALARLGELLGPQAVAPLSLRAAHPPEQRWVERELESAEGAMSTEASLSEHDDSLTEQAKQRAAARLARRKVKERGDAAGQDVGALSREAHARRRKGGAGGLGGGAVARARPGDERCGVVLRARPESLVPLFTGGELTGFRRGRRLIEIVALSPPRRLEGGWWGSQPWARDEYELLAQDGTLYRVGRDLRAKRWLLLGLLD